VRTRSIGQLEVSLVGLGCNNFGRRLDLEATTEVVDAAIDAGITLFDTADTYRGDHGGSEELLGRAIGDRRDEVLVATKFGMEIDADHRGAHPDYVRSACEDSLRRLGTDRIDLYQLHQPDPDVPVSETLGALDELVRAGKVREIGHSNLSSDEIGEADDVARATGGARFVCAQDRWNLLERDVEDDKLAAVHSHGLAVLPYFPLASGLLTGKYTTDIPPDPTSRLASMPAERRAEQLADDRVATASALEAFARDHGHTLLELAFSWLVAHDVVASVIAGATRADQVRSNVVAADWQLTGEELAEVDRITARA
jgi:aryl-alcohol dehydrogenase-like predicted oxidoreductase